MNSIAERIRKAIKRGLAIARIELSPEDAKQYEIPSWQQEGFWLYGIPAKLNTKTELYLKPNINDTMTIQEAIVHLREGRAVRLPDMEALSCHRLTSEQGLCKVHTWGTFINIKFSLDEIMRQDWELY